ncbi:uncharacterized protein LOC109495818 [Felis catus]|uniref:uncharacterized protein LOC109495818 n=1 Tax=Felis catus TaxID=9685 RepID=UPI001D19B633|nr:uncharacterized protein LOC109495818 [Felis catus]XP_044905296.1 uncharacterized protein LOC109495818 [Felis catus]
MIFPLHRVHRASGAKGLCLPCAGNNHQDPGGLLGDSPRARALEARGARRRAGPSWRVGNAGPEPGNQPPAARPRRAHRAVGTPSRRPWSPAPARLFTCRGILAESLSLFARGPREGHLGCRVWPVMCGARVTRDMCSLGCSDDGQLPARWGPGSSPLLAAGPGAGARRVQVCKRDGKELKVEGNGSRATTRGLLVCVDPCKVTPAVSPRKKVLDEQRPCTPTRATVSGRRSPPEGRLLLPWALPSPERWQLSPRSGKTIPLSLIFLSVSGAKANRAVEVSARPSVRGHVSVCRPVYEHTVTNLSINTHVCVCV